MSRGHKGLKYYKSQRYDPDKPKQKWDTYYCDECGTELGDSNAIIYPNDGGTLRTCDDCATKITNNNFLSLKKKRPEDVINDFAEL